MAGEFVRICPTCGSENAVDTLRCACGAMLFGVDLVAKVQPATVVHASDASEASGEAGVEAANTSHPENSPNGGLSGPVCGFADCGQANPPGVAVCQYCNRPLADVSLIQLPASLAERWRIVEHLPAGGAEAEILLVESIQADQPQSILKLYRKGILPQRAILERLATIDLRYRVAVYEQGNADGYAFERLEYCPAGSLRAWLDGKPVSAQTFGEIVRELGAALAAVHAAGLLHRDLKPDNVLVRRRQPLELVLTDFGIASVLDATQRFTSAARSLRYASPESLSGVIDAKTDYWSLGMLLLEAVTGQHPFAGLSDPVILHQLTTGVIDLTEVSDPEQRKLIRGLLLRNPGQRWAGEQVARWLAGDPDLSEPMESGVMATLVEPYWVADERCVTLEQLALAFSRHWSLGIADISNGQLLAWCRDVQKDQNAVRILLEGQYERRLPQDRQLLNILLHFAPGLPPVWRGESIDRSSVLARAQAALQGDAAAADWLDMLYRSRALDQFSQAGNADAQDLLQHWVAAADQFASAWQERAALLKTQMPKPPQQEVVLFDDLVYGSNEKPTPALADMHARLLAMAYDQGWAERLRQHVIAEMQPLRMSVPWLQQLGDPHTLDAASLLVCQALLPEAKLAQTRQQQLQARIVLEKSNEIKELGDTLNKLLDEIQDQSRQLGHLMPDVRELRASLSRYFDFLEQARAYASADEQWLAVRGKAMRAEPYLNRMMALLDQIEQRLIANRGWWSEEVLTALVAAVILVPLLLRGAAPYLLGGAVGAILIWRVSPIVFGVRQIKNLAKRMR